ncbi:MAG: hypothetical protein J6E31_01825 [Pyramidobacter sp.]|nr:hypothetical protein [Pyramidobacter sp.]
MAKKTEVEKTEVEATPAVKETAAAAATVRVKNLTPVSRDYPLNSGESLYLRPAGRGNKGVLVHVEQISEAMRAAERVGAISIETEGGDE